MVQADFEPLLVVDFDCCICHCFGTYLFATRYVGNLQKEKAFWSNIKVLETLRISNTKYIQIVKIGSKCFAIAVCKDTVTYLCELDEETLVYKDSSGQFKSESFKAILDKFKKDKPEILGNIKYYVAIFEKSTERKFSKHHCFCQLFFAVCVYV